MQHWGHLCDLIGDCGEPIRAAGACRLKSDGASPEKNTEGESAAGSEWKSCSSAVRVGPAAEKLPETVVPEEKTNGRK